MTYRTLIALGALFLWTLTGIAGTRYYYLNWAVMRRVKATVLSVRWACRTSVVVQEFIGADPVMIMDRVITYQDAYGDGIYYSCPRFTLTSRDQREVYGVIFFVNFHGEDGRTYAYSVKDLERARTFESSKSWLLNLNQADEILDMDEQL